MIAVSRVSVYAFASTSAVSAYAFASTSAWSALVVASNAAAVARTTSFASADAIASACAFATEPVPVPSTVSKRPLSAVSADVRLAISPASTESFVASTELTSATTSANVSVSAVDADRIASIRDFCTSEYAVCAVVINVSRASVYAAAVGSAGVCAVDYSFRLMFATIYIDCRSPPPGIKFFVLSGPPDGGPPRALVITICSFKVFKKYNLPCSKFKILLSKIK